jgi:hypothetical protein
MSRAPRLLLGSLFEEGDTAIAKEEIEIVVVDGISAQIHTRNGESS